MSMGARIRRLLARVYRRRIHEATHQGDEAVMITLAFLDHKQHRVTRLLFKFRRAR
jgi:hypothetical protein